MKKVVSMTGSIETVINGIIHKIFHLIIILN